MPKPIVVIHGWSDSADSFRNLTEELGRRLERPVENLFLGNWVSMDDEVSYADLRHALAREWAAKRLPTKPFSADVVVHSTGALVVRDWMTTEFEPEEAPVHRFLMLAPANFGSPLAHKGRAFYGRILKGWHHGFQTGKKILQGLELASSFTWELAERDILSPRYRYGSNRVLATVLVGNRGYGGVRSAANEDGGDGTVRISTANLNAVQIRADFATRPTQPGFKVAQPPAHHRAAFGILDGDNHGTITMKEEGTPRNPDALSLMARALSVEPDAWSDWCNELDRLTARVSREAFTGKGNTVKDSSRHAFQNLVVRVRDHLGHDVDSYFLEFYENDSDQGLFARFFHEEVIQKTHTFSGRPCYRNLYIDVSLLHERIDRSTESLDVSLIATPEYDAEAEGSELKVGYKTFSKETELGAVRLGPDRVRQLFAPHRTLLLDIEIRREVGSKVFEITGLG